MTTENTPTRRPRTRTTLSAATPALTLASLALLWAAPGCGDSSPPPVSPVVAADSEEARKALAEDKAEQDLRKQKEAKAARRKKVVLPVEE